MSTERAEALRAHVRLYFAIEEAFKTRKLDPRKLASAFDTTVWLLEMPSDDGWLRYVWDLLNAAFRQNIPDPDPALREAYEKVAALYGPDGKLLLAYWGRKAQTSSATAPPPPTSACAATFSSRMFAHTSPRSPSENAASLSTALTWTSGRITIRPATGGPGRLENQHGTNKDEGNYPRRRRFPDRQQGLARGSNLRQARAGISRRSGTLARRRSRQA